MSPYGGTIYVIVTKAHYNNPFDITINGVIDMPYFIQGRCKVHKYKFRLLVYYYQLQEKQQMMNLMK